MAKLTSNKFYIKMLKTTEDLIHEHTVAELIDIIKKQGEYIDNTYFRPCENDKSLRCGELMEGDDYVFEGSDFLVSNGRLFFWVGYYNIIEVIDEPNENTNQQVNKGERNMKSRTNKVYTVAYKTYGEYNDTQYVDVLAKNKYDAYDKAVWEAIPKEEGRTPYAAWVFSVTYQNGNYRRFNTCCGLPY